MGNQVANRGNGLQGQGPQGIQNPMTPPISEPIVNETGFQNEIPQQPGRRRRMMPQGPQGMQNQMQYGPGMNQSAMLGSGLGQLGLTGSPEVSATLNPGFGGLVNYGPNAQVPATNPYPGKAPAIPGMPFGRFGGGGNRPLQSTGFTQTPLRMNRV